MVTTPKPEPVDTACSEAWEEYRKGYSVDPTPGNAYDFSSGFHAGVQHLSALVAEAEARGANAAKREAFAQVSHELREWAAQHVNAGYPEVQKTLLVAAQVYAEKSEYTRGGADGE